MIKEQLILGLVILQIILLVNFSVAQSYSLSVEDFKVESKIGKYSKRIISDSLNLVIGFLSIKEIGFVSAVYCCEETISNGLCQEVNTIGECDTTLSYSPTSCSSTSFCKEGYCVDSKGLCSLSSQSLCNFYDGQWSTNKPDECTKGCCSLGTNTQYREKAWCEVHNGEFDRDISEAECKYESSDINGACVYQVGEELTCEFVSEKKCNEISHLKFEAGVLCSNEELGTNCEKMNNINCNDGKIYWFDSCGNRENVYTGNVDESDWNLGFVRPKNNVACSVNDNNRDTCGNCDSVSSICRAVDSSDTHVDEGNFVCGDMGCDEDGDGINERRNGESWCVYEGIVGEYDNGDVSISADIPGTTHYRKSCSQGEITRTSCGEYRDTICGESVTEVDGDSFSKATCRANNGRSCFEIEDTNECIDEPDCRVQEVNVIEDYDIDFFSFSACVPRYAEGFDPGEYGPKSWTNADAVCGIATMSCTVLQQYKLEDKCLFREPIFGTCATWFLQKVYLGYIANEACKENKQLFYEQMNDLCVSLGDCAGYINSEGNYTGNSRLKERYTGLNNVPIENDAPEYIGLVSERGSSSSIILQLLESTVGKKPSDAEETMSRDEKDIHKWRAANTLAITIGATSGNPWGWIVAIIGTLIEVAFFQGNAEKVGQIEAEQITFYCNSWEPPSRSEDCEKCNEGDFPCTDYKCWSLGKNCDALEDVEGLGNEEVLCITNEESITSPNIKFTSISDKFKWTSQTDSSGRETGVSITNKSGECIDGNDRINFVLTTDEDDENKYAKCMYGYENTNYNEYKSIWNDLPESGSSFTKSHNFTVRVPYYESSYVKENGEFKVYIRCENHKGVANIDPYVLDMCVRETPDITAPIIEEFEPKNEWYLEYGKSSLENLIVTTNEPVLSCGYSFNQNTDYEDLTSSLYCDSDAIPLVDYTCTFSAIDDLTEDISTIYFKCKDTQNNTMLTFTEYNILKSLGELDIISTTPTGYNKVSSAQETVPVTLKVVTANGGDDSGFATCYWNYSWSDYDSAANGKEIEFSETGATTHTQEINFYSGSYSVPVRCEDEYGNNAYSNIEFDLDVDANPPEIATIYKTGSNLYVTTNKEAWCYFDILDTAQCNVDTGNVSLLMSPTSASVTHYTNWDDKSTYHVQCIDNLDNIGKCVSIAPSLF
ncbi:MAG: hypothetical protein OQK82_01970 [Candidatus Pacearchaeota archaeon]|nr:hypothetical protein [Candidatus Pacearchaeota archaeon]